MHPAFRTVVILLLSAPAFAGAQRVGGFPGRGMMKGPAREPAVVAPKQVNMVNLLIEHRQDLTLGDEQFARLIAIKRSLDSTNAPLLRKVDSVERLFRGGPIFAEISRARRDSISDGDFLVRQLAASLRENYAEAREKAYALLDAQQRPKAQDIQAKAEKAIEEKKGWR